MPDPPPLVDIHCHLLPGLDDGSTDWEETLAMARMAVADGISTIVATPHQLGSYGHNDAGTIRAQTARLREVLKQRGIPLRVLPGADVRIEPDMIGKLHSGDVLTLADRRRHVLLELPHELYVPLGRLVSDLAAGGMVGILSHPERNMGILARRDVLAPLVRGGCLIQLTASSLVGAFGPRVQKFSRWLIRQQLVHFVSTDAHGAKSRRPLLRRAFRCVAALAGQEAAVELCCRNPARVVAGQDVVSARRGPAEKGPASWLHWKKAG